MGKKSYRLSKRTAYDMYTKTMLENLRGYSPRTSEASEQHNAQGKRHTLSFIDIQVYYRIAVIKDVTGSVTYYTNTTTLARSAI